MSAFESIRQALRYIEEHLEEPLRLEALAERFHFSPYYFHRLFALVVGKTYAAYVRERRLEKAGWLLGTTQSGVLEIGIACGYDSAPSFARAFKNAYGSAPSAYRRQGCIPTITTVDEWIERCTNRLQGGLYLNPNIIKRGAMRIAGVSGDGNKTAEVWQALEELTERVALDNKRSEDGYEIRFYQDGRSIVHVGYLIEDGEIPAGYAVEKLPASQYASFDVYVANGYGSENDAMNEWLRTNQAGYRERMLGDRHYVVERYDERFQGEEAGSIVEIWVPIEKEA